MAKVEDLVVKITADVGPFVEALDQLKRSLLTAKVYGDIAAERRRQDEQWGGPEHDDQHTISDFVGYITRQLHQADTATSIQEWRHQLVQVAALAIAAIESLDRTHPTTTEEEA